MTYPTKNYILRLSENLEIYIRLSKEEEKKREQRFGTYNILDDIFKHEKKKIPLGAKIYIQTYSIVFLSHI